MQYTELPMHNYNLIITKPLQNMLIG